MQPDLILMPSGSGVILPQPETMVTVKEWNKKHVRDKTAMIIATASEFFDSLEKRATATKYEFEVRKGEMLLEGCLRYFQIAPLQGCG